MIADNRHRDDVKTNVETIEEDDPIIEDLTSLPEENSLSKITQILVEFRFIGLEIGLVACIGIDLKIMFD